MFSGLSGSPASAARAMRDSYLSIKERNPGMNENEVLIQTLGSRYPEYDPNKLSNIVHETPNIRSLTFVVIGKEFGQDKVAKYMDMAVRDVNEAFKDIGMVSIDIDEIFRKIEPNEEGIWNLKWGMSKQDLINSFSDPIKSHLEMSRSESLCAYRAIIGDISMDITLVFANDQFQEINFFFCQPFFPIKENLSARYGEPLDEREEKVSGFPTNTIMYWETQNLEIRLDYNKAKFGGISFTVKSTQN